MDLNLGNILFTSTKTNHFKPDFKDSYDISLAFHNIIQPLVDINQHNLIQTYQPTCGVVKDEVLYIGDQGGYVLQVNEN